MEIITSGLAVEAAVLSKEYMAVLLAMVVEVVVVVVVRVQDHLVKLVPEVKMV